MRTDSLAGTRQGTWRGRVGKLLSRVVSGAVNVIGSLPYLLAAERHVHALSARLDRPAMTSIIAHFARIPEFRGGRKYLRASWYVRDSMARAVALGLDHNAPLRILDLGSGAGYFLLACRHFGHEVLGFDLPGNRFYAEMFRHLGLPRVEGAIQRMQPLGAVEGKFDLVTAFAVTFAKIRSADGTADWGEAEWRFFFEDIRGRLNPGGRLFLRLNLLPVAGLRDRRRYPFLYRPIPGYEVTVLNRREVCLKAVRQR